MGFNFHIDGAAFVSTLPVMLMGMLGGMLVMAIICLILMGLYRAGRAIEDKKKTS